MCGRPCASRRIFVGLEVAVDQPLLVGERECLGRPAIIISAARSGVSRSRASSADERPALDVLQDDETTDVRVAIDLVNGDDAGVLDPGGEPGLVQEAVEVLAGRRNRSARGTLIATSRSNCSSRQR